MARDKTSHAIEADVLGFIIQITRYKRPINKTTMLYHDLSIAGDDAWELFENIQKEFGTSFEEFDFDSYFPNESDAFFYHLAKLFGFRDKKRKNLSFGHLLKVVERGKWFEPEE